MTTEINIENNNVVEETPPAPPRKKRDVLIGLLVIFELIGIAASVYLTWIKFQAAGDSVCDINSKISCSTVAASNFSAILGIPIAYLGILTYIVCLVFTLLGAKPEKNRFRAHIPLFLLAISIWCVIYSVFLALISTLIIKAVCIFCITLYVVNIGMLICSVVWSGDIAEGTIKPLWQDFLLALKSPQVWGFGVAMVILLVISGVIFSQFKPKIKFVNDKVFDLTVKPVMGDISSPVRIIEVSDPKCPWCAKSHEVIRKAQITYGEKFYVYFVFFPLDMECNSGMKKTVHPGACLGAYAAHCAQLQGKFWEYMDVLFERQEEDWTAYTLTGYARELGLNEDTFHQCISDPATIDYIKNNVAEADKAGVHATPTIYFNGKQYGGVSSGLPAFMENLQKALTDNSPVESATAEQTLVPNK